MFVIATHDTQIVKTRRSWVLWLDQRHLRLGGPARPYPRRGPRSPDGPTIAD